MAETVGSLGRWFERALWVGAALVVLKLAWPEPTARSVGHEAPVLSLPSVTSTGSVPVAPRAGRPLLLEVFASWCGACRHSSGALSSLARASSDGSFDVLAVSVDDDRTDARRAAETWPIPVPVVHDEHGAFSRAYRIRVLPTYIWIDAKGVIREVSSGPPGARELRRWLNAGK